MALEKSQATLHCIHKARLYAIAMTLGTRIRTARERLKPRPTQAALGEKFDPPITGSAVSQWELDVTVPELPKLPRLARELKVPLAWLLDGKGPPPPPDDPEVLIHDLLPAERAAVKAMIQSFHQQRQPAA